MDEPRKKRRRRKRSRGSSHAGQARRRQIAAQKRRQKRARWWPNLIDNLVEFKISIQRRFSDIKKRIGGSSMRSEVSAPSNETNFWQDLRQYIFVIRELTAREIKRKYVRSVLGIFWSVLDPLLHMIVMSLIFSTMFRRNIENFPIYYLTGQIFFKLFSTATNSSMSVLVDNKNLLIKAKLPKQTFILSRIYTALVNFGYTCIAYVLILLVFRITPHWTMLLFFVDVVFALFFSMGIGYMLSVAYVFFADIKYLYSVFLTLLMYMSAIFYPISRLPEVMKRVIEYNPVYIIIAFARECVMYGNVPDGSLWCKLLVCSAGSFVLGLMAFRAKENQIMQKI